jgi:RNA polymerase sigma-70 factor (ECF subfamily)
MLEITDNILVQKSLADSESFGLVIEKYAPLLARYIYRLGCINKEDREDVLQEIFIKVYSNLNEYDLSLPFSSWIYRIAHNEAISFFRKKNVRPHNTLDINNYEYTLAVEDHLYDLYDSKIRTTDLQNALQKIPEKYKEVLVLHYFEEKSYDEISDILKKPPNTVATLIRRAKEKVRVIV